MKKIFFLFVILSLNLNAQDTIRFRNGEVKVVKVTEVGVDYVKYNRFDNASGPLYTVPKNDVRYIKYSGGGIDSFPIVKTEIKQIVHPQQTPNFPINQFACDKLTFGKKGKVLCNGYPLSETNFKFVLLSLPEGEKKTNIMKAYYEMKSYKRKQYQYGFGGLIVLVAAPMIGVLASVFSGVYGDISTGPYLVGIAVGGVAAIAGLLFQGTTAKNEWRNVIRS
ncbi:MAG TPA: hypothetical protein VN026_13955 [Bacteroidia bacterium]|jgi:hypothetical protein|nr:hypothetical protein [Bacteroidia bacterium]